MNIYSLRTAALLLKAKPHLFVLACVGTFLFFGIRSRYFEKSSDLQPMTVSKENFSGHSLNSSWGHHPTSESQGQMVKANPWDLLLQKHTEYHPIGDVWDKCDNKTRVNIGKVVLEPNDDNTGSKMTLLSNLTFKNDVTGGKAYLHVYYKTHTLYRKNYDLCDKLGKLEEPIPCPFKKGQVLVLRRLIEMPTYLPKGDFRVHMDAQDQLGNQFGCAEMRFKTRT